jgi:beta-galactosidase GanA
MYFGTQYYRSPFPRREYWEDDIKHIKDLNFNVVKLWAVWNCIEKTPGIFDFSELDELVSICSKYGVKCIINTIPEGAPYWTASGFEDSFYKTSDGHILDYSGPANIPSAGWPGLCPDSTAANELMCRFISSTARHFKDNETVAAIDVWNEPHLEPMFDYSGQLLCYCTHSINKFRSWLKERYGTLENLNSRWFRHYTSWEQVMPPSRFGTSADMIDWRRFWLYNLAQWIRARVAAAKEAAPHMMIQTHTAFSGYMGAENEGGLGNELGDEFLLAREVDAFGLSSFPLWLMGEKHLTGHLINAEIIAESSRGKPFYQMELQGGAGKKGLLGGIVPSAEDIRLWNFNVIAAGGKGVVYWQFKPEPAGLESPGFGLVNPDGSDTPRSISAAECARRLSREDLANARRVLPQNGIYLSRSSDLLAYSVKEESKYNNSFKGIYNLLLDKGIPVRFIHEDYLDKVMDEGLKVLYLPMCLSLSDREKLLLAEFVRKGGTLIAEGCAGMYNEYGEMDPSFEFLNSLFGMRNVWIEAIRDEHAYAQVLNESGEVGFMLYRQLFEKADEYCTEIARFDDGKTAALAKTIGDGKAIWVSGFAGLEYNTTGHPGTGDFIASLFAYPGYAAVEKMESQGMLMRMLEDSSYYYIVAVNYSDTDKNLFVTLKSGKTVGAGIKARDGEVLKVEK